MPEESENEKRLLRLQSVVQCRQHLVEESVTAFKDETDSNSGANEPALRAVHSIANLLRSVMHSDVYALRAQEKPAVRADCPQSAQEFRVHDEKKLLKLFDKDADVSVKKVTLLHLKQLTKPKSMQLSPTLANFLEPRSGRALTAELAQRLNAKYLLVVIDPLTKAKHLVMLTL